MAYKFDRFNNTIARMLDSIYHTCMALRLLQNLISGVKKLRFCHYDGCHFIMLPKCANH